MKYVVLAAVLAASSAGAVTPEQPPAVSAGLKARCTLVGQAASRADVSGEYIVTDAKTDCGDLVGPDRTGGRQWRWASVTKQVIAVAVMQQVEAGKVALDTSIAAYVPTLKVANDDKVTLRMLLQHTSGLPNVEDGLLDAKRETLVEYRYDAPPPPAISPICLGKPKAEPGVRFEYNNCDTEIVGAVLEGVTGISLDKLLASDVFAPSGMRHTRLLHAGDPSGRLGYLADGRSDDFIDVGRFGAAGAIAGSPHDLAQFDRALMSNALILPSSREVMWRSEPKFGYAALGQWVYTVPLRGCPVPQRLVERRGEIGGVQVRNVIAPDRGLALVVFTDRPFDFGEAWQGKGGAYDLMSAAFCP